jgi:hypothetical protein
MVAQSAAGVAHRPRRQNVVVPLQHVARRGGGGDHDGRRRAELQRHDGAVLRREPGQGVVRLTLELKDVTEERQSCGARRPPRPRLVRRGRLWTATGGGQHEFVQEAGGQRDVEKP